MNEIQRRWLEKGIETARRIVDRCDPPTARLVLAICPQCIDHVADDFDIDTFVANITRRFKKDGRVYPPVFNLQEAAIGIFVAAAKIERERDRLLGKSVGAANSRDEITYSCEMLREIGLDLAGVPYHLHICEEDKFLDESGDCLFCKTNNVNSFKDRLVRDFVTAEFAALDSGDAVEVADALQRLRTYFSAET